MNSLEINFVNDLNFKFIHDLIVAHDSNEIYFYESFDDVDLDHMFIIAHILQLLNPELKLVYKTFRDVFPIEELSPELSLREIPFDCIILKDKEILL